MQLLCADFVMPLDDACGIIQKGAVVFEETIIEVGRSEDLKLKYPDATMLETPPNSVLLPGLINVHTHLEYSANTTSLVYGDFMQWLYSVIRHRERISAMATTELIASKLKEMLHSGTTTLGAISSFGADLEACVQSPQRVVYFNEVLGSVAYVVDTMYTDFLNRFEMSKEHASLRFFPAVAVHSPYSTHPVLAKKALLLAQEEGCVVSTHFMESQAERQWIDTQDGDFKAFLSTYNPDVKPLYTPLEYLEMFQNANALFTHGVQANHEELTLLSSQHATLTHCPVSNRLLGVGKLDLSAIQRHDINLTLGTDGLSSNISLNLWDEMRAAVLMHTDENLVELAKVLLHSVTINAAKALHLPCGSLKKGLYADIIVVQLPESCQSDMIPLQLILHTHQTVMSFINGVRYV